MRSTGAMKQSSCGPCSVRSCQSVLLAMVVLASCGPVQGSDRVPTTTPGSTLTTALEVHQLPSSVAERAYPVRLRAVITYYDPANQLLFVQDRSDGIFVELQDDGRKVPMRAADEVEVTGVTSAGFAPNVSQARIRVLGHSSLPVPKTGSFESAIRGREDCRWLELGGIVQRVAKRNGDTLLTLAFGANTYEAYVLAPPEALTHLVDAEVKLRGGMRGHVQFERSTARHPDVRARSRTDSRVAGAFAQSFLHTRYTYCGSPAVFAGKGTGPSRTSARNIDIRWSVWVRLAPRCERWRYASGSRHGGIGPWRSGGCCRLSGNRGVRPGIARSPSETIAFRCAACTRAHQRPRRHEGRL